jgi:hypothetical protein
MSLRHPVVIALVATFAACGGGSPPAPTPRPTLTFTFTPNPVPTSGLQVGCGGLVVPAKTWNYTLRVENTSSTPFAVSSLTYTLANTGGVPATSPPLDPAVVALAFGTSTIPANGSIQGALCTYLTGASGTVSYSFTGTDGRGPFTTATLQLLP